MEDLYNQKIINTNNVFDNYFLDSKIMYLNSFNSVPSLHFIKYVEGEKVFNVFKEKYSGIIKYIHQYSWYKQKKKAFQFDSTLIIFNNNCLVELGKDYCEILHDGRLPEFIHELATLANQFRVRQRREPLEINLIVQDRHGLQLKAMEIKKTKLDLSLFYEDDFMETDAIIRKRLSQKKDKGIVLLHGLPGTGKTTYLRYLVGKIKKKMLFLSPGVAQNLMNPEFIELLVDNPDTVLIIEDAENIIMDRKYNSGSAVSSLLNISDGLLADFLNVQLICTFNSPLTLIDSALLRKGRLIAKYEFGKLGVNKAQVLSKHLGFDTIVQQPMTIAEIANPHEKDQKSGRIEIVGFRRDLIESEQTN